MKTLTVLWVVAMSFATAVAADSAAGRSHPALIPAPAKVEWRDGVMPKDGAVRMDRIAGLPEEGYEIEISTTGAVIRASSDAGAFYAQQTLRQLRADDGMMP